MFDKLLEAIISVRCSAKEAESTVPDSPGYYAIFVDNPTALPEPFSTSHQPGNPIYIGIATKSLKQRLARQDLKGKSNATFFRGIGAMLDYCPEPGSLRNKKNKNNYKFSPANTQRIINWIDQHLSISWVEKTNPQGELEKELIETFVPIFNTQHNPHALLQLSELRKKCRKIAR